MFKKAVFLVALLILFKILNSTNIVYADTWSPTVTKVFFSLNGKPYYGKIEYKVTCYGYEYDQEEFSQVDYGKPNPFPPKRQKGTYTPVEVYIYSGSCATYGCEVYEPYYYKYIGIDSCNIEGTANGQTFKVSNIGENPYTTCSVWDYRSYLDIYNGKVVRNTNKRQDCIDNLKSPSEECYKYLIECSKDDAICTPRGEMTIDGKDYGKDKEGKWQTCYTAAREAYDKELNSCDQYFKEIPIDEIPFTNLGSRGGGCELAMDTCTLSIKLPSNITYVEKPTEAVKPTRPSNEECFQNILSKYNKNKKVIEENKQSTETLKTSANTASSTRTEPLDMSNNTSPKPRKLNNFDAEKYFFIAPILLIIISGILLYLVRTKINDIAKKTESTANEEAGHSPEKEVS